MSRLVGLLTSPSVFEDSGFSLLPETQSDAVRLTEALKELWSPESGTQLRALTGQVSRTEIFSQLRELVGEASPDDTFIFYYSGHGIAHQSGSYLVASDSQMMSPSDTCIALDCIVQELKPINRKVIVVDACKAGLVTRDGFALSTLSSLPAVEEFAPHRFIALISAGSAHEDAQAGVFANSFIDGLRHFAATIGNVDIFAFFEYVRQDVRRRTQGRQNPAMSSAGSPLTLELSAAISTGQNRDLVKQTHVLAVFANPKGSKPLSLDNEGRVMLESIRLSLYRDHIKLDIIRAARVDDFARALLEKDYQIVHFSGHATGIGLAFEDENQAMQIVAQDALAETLSAYSPPIECVLLNACYSNAHAESISMGVPYTIAMDGPISDKGATEFTRGFYDAIGAGKGTQFAYKEGCRRIKLKGLRDGSIPVLIARSAS